MLYLLEALNDGKVYLAIRVPRRPTRSLAHCLVRAPSVEACDKCLSVPKNVTN